MEILITEESVVSVTPPESNKQVVFTLHNIVLITIWLLTTASFVIMLFGGVRNTGHFRVIRNILQTAYVLALFWYLIRTGPPVKILPDLNPLILPKRSVGKLIPVFLIALLLLTDFADQGLLQPLLMLATIWILIIQRRGIGFSAVLLGLAVTAIAFLGGLPWIQNQYVGKGIFIIFLSFIMPMLIAGGLLSKRTGLPGDLMHPKPPLSIGFAQDERQGRIGDRGRRPGAPGLG